MARTIPCRVFSLPPMTEGKERMSGAVSYTHLDPKDRRNTCVALTESGEDMQQNMTCTMQEFGRAVISQMDEQDLKKLIVCLDELYDIAAEEIEKRSMRNRKEGQHGKDF